MTLLLLVALLGCSDTDADGDGYGASVDCNDQDPGVNPGADEICDGWDNDCDGQADVDAVDAATFYADADGDGFGDPTAAVVACSQGDDLVTDATDCDDADADAHPGAAESCSDTVDLNCDGSVGADNLDGDAFAACEECDDADPDVFPGATEACNGNDDDCDGRTDEGACDYTHDVDIQPIWDATCVSRCHSVPAPSGDLDLAAGGYDAIVGQPSGQAPMDLVMPGSLDDSYLHHKLMGTHLSVGGSGTRMPKTGSLSAADLAKIEAWILDGAVR